MFALSPGSEAKVPTSDDNNHTDLVSTGSDGGVPAEWGGTSERPEWGGVSERPEWGGASELSDLEQLVSNSQRVLREVRDEVHQRELERAELRRKSEEVERQVEEMPLAVPGGIRVRGPLRLQPYGGPAGGRGHHVPAKSAFKGAPGYDPKVALAIPHAELQRLGVSHQAITGAQQTIYRALARTGAQRVSWRVIAQIETAALVRGGVPPAAARATVAKAIKALRDAGIKEPTAIPWGGL